MCTDEKEKDRDYREHEPIGTLLHNIRQNKKLSSYSWLIFLDPGIVGPILWLSGETTVKRLVPSFGVLVLAGFLGAYGSTRLSAASGQAATTASLSGTASSSSGQKLPGTVVQLRSLATGQLAGTTTSGALGQFGFVDLNPGNYAVEVVNAAGQIVGTSASVMVSVGAAVTEVGVTASTALATASPVASGAAVGRVAKFSRR